MSHNLQGKNYFAGLKLTFRRKSELKLWIKNLGLGLEMELGVRVWKRISISTTVKSSSHVTLRPVRKRLPISTTVRFTERCDLGYILEDHTSVCHFSFWARKKHRVVTPIPFMVL